MDEMTRPSQQPDSEAAKFYEDRRGSTAGWTHNPKSIRNRRGSPSSVFSIRLAQDEVELIQEAADREGKTVSGFVRDSALRMAQVRPILQTAHAVRVVEIATINQLFHSTFPERYRVAI